MLQHTQLQLEVVVAMFLKTQISFFLHYGLFVMNLELKESHCRQMLNIDAIRRMETALPTLEQFQLFQVLRDQLTHSKLDRNYSMDSKRHSVWVKFHGNLPMQKSGHILKIKYISRNTLILSFSMLSKQEKVVIEVTLTGQCKLLPI